MATEKTKDTTTAAATAPQKINFKDTRRWHGWVAEFREIPGRGWLAIVARFEKATTESQSVKTTREEAESWALSELETKRF